MQSVRARQFKRAILGSLPLLGSLFQQGQAKAQTVVDPRMERDTVTTRSRPGFEAIGIAFGSFKLQPSVTTVVDYNDNIYATQVAKVGDGSVRVRPSVSIQSQWSRHAINASASVEASRHFRYGTENTTQYDLATDGRLDLGANTVVTARTSIARHFEARGRSGDTLVGAKPIAFQQVSAGASANQQFGKLRIGLDGSFDRYTYADRKLGGVVIDLGDRNFESLSGSAQVSYAVGPGIAAFASGSVNRARYTEQTGPISRDSKGYSLLGGVSFGLTRLLQGQIAAGYQRQNFEDPTFPRISGLDYAVRLRWSPTQLLTVSGSAAKSVQRSPIQGVAGIAQSDFSLSADYELLRNLLIRPVVRYSISSYRGAGRSDHYYDSDLQIRWLLNQRFALTFSGGHGMARPASSSIGGRRYDQNRFSLGLAASF